MNQICVNKVNHYHIVLSSGSNHKTSSNRQQHLSYPIPLDSGQNLGVPDYQVSEANFKINHIIAALLEFLKT